MSEYVIMTDSSCDLPAKLAEEMEARMDEMRGIVMEAEKTGPFHEEIRTAGKNRITGS